MEKTLNIDGRQVTFKSTGAFLLRYKMQFKREALQDIIKLQYAINEVEDENGNKHYTISDINAFDLEVFYNLIWTLAKTADSTIPTPMEWLDSFNLFPLMDILPELMDMITSSMRSTAEPKKK